jgi:hypothetical protein
MRYLVKARVKPGQELAEVPGLISSSSIQPRLNGLFCQLLRDFANRWLIFTVVAQEYIEDFSVVVLRAHTETILYGKHGTKTKQLRRIC